MQTCIPLSHKVLGAFLTEFKGLLMETVVNGLFHLSIQRYESCGGEIWTVCHMLQYLSMHSLHISLDGVHYVKVCVIMKEDDSMSHIL
jgi:hypothetical protein